MDSEDILKGDAKCAEVSFREQLESSTKRNRQRFDHLEQRIARLEETVNRFNQIFSAIIQDEVLRNFRMNMNGANPFVDNAIFDRE